MPNPNDTNRPPSAAPDLPPAFHCAVVAAGDRVVVTPRGELDLATAPKLDARMAEACAGGAQRLVLDLTELEFMDSTGLQLVLRWAELSAADGFLFEVVPGGTRIQRVFTLSGMANRLPFVEPDDGSQAR